MKVVKLYLKSEIIKTLDSVLLDTGEIKTLQSNRYLAVPSKKNQRTPIQNKSTGDLFIKQSEQFLKWKKQTDVFFNAEYWKLYNANIRLPIVKCKINILFFFGDDKDKDCTNKAETIMDALVEHEIIADDSFKVVNNISIKGFLCRDRPRTEIYITIIDAGEAGYEYDVTNYEKYNQSKKEKRANKYKFEKIKKQLV